MNNSQECQVIMQRILTETQIILRRPDPLQRQLCKELWIEFGIKMDKLNEEMRVLLG